MPLLCGLAIPSGGFVIILLYSMAFPVAVAKITLRTGMPLLCGLAIPSDCFFIIFVYSQAIPVAFSQIILCTGMPLLCGLAIPFDCFFIIPGYSQAILVAEAKIRLPRGIPLFCALAIPSGGFVIILLYSMAFLVAVSKPSLSQGMPLLSSFTIILRSFIKIYLVSISTIVIIKAHLIIISNLLSPCFFRTGFILRDFLAHTLRSLYPDMLYVGKGAQNAADKQGYRSQRYHHAADAGLTRGDLGCNGIFHRDGRGQYALGLRFRIHYRGLRQGCQPLCGGLPASGSMQ